MHSYLSTHRETNMGLLKEYHLFDVLEFGEAVPFRRRFTQQLHDASETLKVVGPDKPRKYARALSGRDEASMRLEFYDDPEKYAAYFAKLAAEPGVKVVGDITPNYGLLPEDRLRSARLLLEAHGLRVKTVFLMRDPVSRFYSAVRMRLRKKQAGAKSEKVLKSIYRDCLDQSFYLERSRYENTLERLDRCFAPEDIFLGFFEEFFQESEIARLTDFLGIAYTGSNFHSGKKTAPQASTMDSELVKECRRRLEPTYQYCFDRFGEGRIKSLWSNAISS